MEVRKYVSCAPSKYATIDIPGARSFTAISNELAKEGKPLTPARTRIIVLKSLEKIIRKLGKIYGHPISREKAEEIVKDTDFQNTIAPLIQKAYEE